MIAGKKEKVIFFHYLINLSVRKGKPGKRKECNGKTRDINTGNDNP
jgi:hypothetical protein